MKRIFAGISFVFLLAQAMPGSEIRAMAGMNWNKYLFPGETDSLNSQQKTGFTTGIGWALDVKTNVKFEINMLYSQKGAKVSLPYATGKSITGIYKNTTIGFPIFLKYQFKEKASPYAALGPEFIFILSHHLKIPENEIDFDLRDSTKKFILAFNALLGYEWPIGQWGLFAELRYNHWLGNFLVDPEATVKSGSFAFLLGGVYYL